MRLICRYKAPRLEQAAIVRFVADAIDWVPKAVASHGGSAASAPPSLVVQSLAGPWAAVAAIAPPAATEPNGRTGTERVPGEPTATWHCWNPRNGRAAGSMSLAGWAAAPRLATAATAQPDSARRRQAAPPP